MLATNLSWTLYSAGQLPDNCQLHFSAVNSSAHQFSPISQTLFLVYHLFDLMRGLVTWVHSR